MKMTFENWHEDFSRFAEDLYPGRYARDYVQRLAEMGEEVRRLAQEKNSVIVAHNYNSCYALDNTCTHGGGPLAEGAIEQGEVDAPGMVLTSILGPGSRLAHQPV